MAARAGHSERFGEDILSCTICYEPYKKPKILPCCHTFCQDCLHRHYETYKLKNTGRVSCPSCREMIPLPPKGVPGFREDVTVSKIKELLRAIPTEEAVVTSVSESPTSSSEDEEKRQALVNYLDELQGALAKLRTKILQVYAVENHVKITITLECSRIPGNFKGEERAKKEAQIRESRGPALAQLAKQMDRLYQDLCELRSVHDIAEETLQKGNLAQLRMTFDIVHEALLRLRSTVITDELMDVEGGAVGGVPVNHRLLGVSLPEDGLKLTKEPVKQQDLKCVKPRLRYKISGRGVGVGQFDWPTHGCFLPNGDLLVCDKNNLRIQMFDQFGNFKTTMFCGEVKPKRVVANTQDGLIYVSDELSQCVKVFDMSGKIVRRIGDMYFQSPAGIAVDSRGNIVMTDAERCFISLHQPNGEVVNKFYARFLDDLRIPNPYYVAVNDDDQLIVTDCRNNCVKVFSNTGQFLFKIPKLRYPRGVCVDPFGNIYIAEGDMHRVSVYSPHGKLVRHLLTKEDGLEYPLALSMSQEGYLAVFQCGFYSPHEVLVFEVYET